MMYNNILELNDSQLPDVQGEFLPSGYLLQGIVCTKHIEHLLQTLTRCLDLRYILRRRCDYDLI